MRGRLHRFLAFLLIGGYGLWAALKTTQASSWTGGVAGGATAAVLLAAAVGALLCQGWAKALIYLLTAIVVVRWCWYVASAYLRGNLDYLRHLPALKVVLTFVPAAVMFLLLWYCCYVASRYVAPTEHI